MDCQLVREGETHISNATLEPMHISPSFVPSSGEVLLCSIRGTTVRVRSTGVVRKGIRRANGDFAVLGVSRKGKCHNAWCPAT